MNIFRQCVNEVSEFAARIVVLGGESKITVSEPLNLAEIISHRTLWPNDVIPSTLIDFWSAGCSQLRFEYAWEPKDSMQKKQLSEIFPYSHYLHGGATILHPRKLYPGNWPIDDTNIEMKEEVGETAFQWWKESAIFHWELSGDCLALGCGVFDHDPPVLYLSQKDRSSKVISSSFSDFLCNWRKILYLSQDTFRAYCDDALSSLVNGGPAVTPKLQDLLFSK